MEPLSVAANIGGVIGIADVALRLTAEIYTFIARVTKASVELRRLHAVVKTLENSISESRGLLKRWQASRYQMHNQDLLVSLDEALTSSTQNLQELKDVLGKPLDRTLSVVNRFGARIKCVLDEKQIAAIAARIEASKLSLVQVLSSIGRNNDDRLLMDMAQAIDTIDAARVEQKTNLSPLQRRLSEEALANVTRHQDLLGSLNNLQNGSTNLLAALGTALNASHTGIRNDFARAASRFDHYLDDVQQAVGHLAGLGFDAIEAATVDIGNKARSTPHDAVALMGALGLIYPYLQRRPSAGDADVYLTRDATNWIITEIKLLYANICAEAGKQLVRSVHSNAVATASALPAQSPKSRLPPSRFTRRSVLTGRHAQHEPAFLEARSLSCTPRFDYRPERWTPCSDYPRGREFAAGRFKASAEACYNHCLSGTGHENHDQLHRITLIFIPNEEFQLPGVSASFIRSIGEGTSRLESSISTFNTIGDDSEIIAYARNGMARELLKALKTGDVAANDRDDSGKSLLSHALDGGHVETICPLLLLKGADIQDVDSLAQLMSQPLRKRLADGHAFAAVS